MAANGPKDWTKSPSAPEADDQDAVHTEQLAIYPERRLLHRFLRVALLDGLPRPGPSACALLFRQAPARSPSTAASAAASPGATRQPVTPVLDRLDRTAMIGRDHRPRHRLRLDHHPAERLRLGRGVNDQIGQHQRRRHVVALAGEAQPTGDAEPLGTRTNSAV